MVYGERVGEAERSWFMGSFLGYAVSKGHGLWVA